MPPLRAEMMPPLRADWLMRKKPAKRPGLLLRLKRLMRTKPGTSGVLKT